MLPFANFLRRFCSWKIKLYQYPVGLTAKLTSISSKRFTPSVRTLCLCSIIAAGYGHINSTCHFSPIRMLCSWVYALHSENNALRAGSHILCQVRNRSFRSLTPLSGLSNRLIPAWTHESLLAGYLQSAFCPQLSLHDFRPGLQYSVNPWTFRRVKAKSDRCRDVTVT